MRKRILATLLLFFIGAVVWFTFFSKDPIRRYSENYWCDNGIGVLRRLSDDRWEQCAVIPGNGVNIKIRDGGFDTRTFDGGWSYEVNLQLPETFEEGKRLSLQPVTAKRKVFAKESRVVGMMKSGEFTAFRFGNPMMDWIKNDDSSSYAYVTIQSISPTAVKAHIELFARLHNIDDLHIDKSFLFRRRLAEDPSWAYEYFPIKEMKESVLYESP